MKTSGAVSTEKVEAKVRALESEPVDGRLSIDRTLLSAVFEQRRTFGGLASNDYWWL